MTCRRMTPEEIEPADALPAVVAVGADSGAYPETRARTRAGDRVTEPDPIAALAAQLEELRGQLARYTGETGQLRARWRRTPARS